MESRKGGWIQVFSGKQIWPIDPRIGDFDIKDIAHALSNICRFAGHVRKFYSVAQHSVLVSHSVPEGMAMEGLIHDASEAYLVDIPRPVKHDPALIGYRGIEKQMEFVIARQFGVSYPWPAEVKSADDKALVTERRDLLSHCPIAWTTVTCDPLRRVIKPWSPEKAERKFLERYYELGGK
jgi:hypothetical protein